MDKIILAALLTEWEAMLGSAISDLEEYPILKYGRKELHLASSPELADLWNVKGSISNLIEALEKAQ